MTREKMFKMIKKSVIEIRNTGITEDRATSIILNGMKKFPESELMNEQTLKIILQSLILTA